MLKQYLLKLDAIHGQKFGLQWLMNNFKGNALIFFLILLTVFNETRTKKWWYSRVTLEIRTWKPVVVFIETQVFLVKLRPSASTPPKKTWFQWNHHRFQVLTPKEHVKPSFFVRVSSKPSTKKKMSGFPLKPILKRSLVAKYTTVKSFIFKKWGLNNTNFGFRFIKRLPSHEWNDAHLLKMTAGQVYECEKFHFLQSKC